MTAIRQLDVLEDWVRELSRIVWPEEAEQPKRRVADQIFAKLLEEGGELVQQTHKFFGRRLRPDDNGDGFGDVDALIDECGDVGVVWLRICVHLGIDPAVALTRVLGKIERRARESGLMPDKPDQVG